MLFRSIGFDDSFIYDEIKLPIELRSIETKQLLRNEAIEGFKKWENFDGKIEY